MKKSGRIAIGTLVVALCVWASQLVLGLLAFGYSTPFERWPSQTQPLLLGYEFVAYAPFVLLAGFVLGRWCGIRQLSEVMFSAALGVTLAAGEGIFESPHYIRDAADELFRVAVYFVLGVPVVVLLASRSRISLRGREKI